MSYSVNQYSSTRNKMSDNAWDRNYFSSHILFPNYSWGSLSQSMTQNFIWPSWNGTSLTQWQRIQPLKRESWLNSPSLSATLSENLFPVSMIIMMMMILRMTTDNSSSPIIIKVLIIEYLLIVYINLTIVYVKDQHTMAGLPDSAHDLFL